jgi:predicted methyltransferase
VGYFKVKYKGVFYLMFNIYNSIEEVQAVGRIPVNSIIKADCLEAMKHIADKSIDAIITDPPYG